MRVEDAVRIRHMIEAAESIIEFVAGTTLSGAGAFWWHAARSTRRSSSWSAGAASTRRRRHSRALPRRRCCRLGAACKPMSATPSRPTRPTRAWPRTVRSRRRIRRSSPSACATAKSLKRYELAIELAWVSPCDPKTLTRAARDHLNDQPAFAAQAAMHWMATGHGYELTGIDVFEALRHGTEAARRLGQEQQVQQRLRQSLASNHPAARWMRQVVGIA